MQGPDRPDELDDRRRVALLLQPDYTTALHDLLLKSTSNDTAQIKTATIRLHEDFFKFPACISALASVVASAPEAHVRQLAAVELRKRISHGNGDLWIKLPHETQEEIKNQLPNIVLAEPNKLVRRSAAQVFAAIAAIEVPAGTWSQLLPFLHQASTAQRVDHREVGAYILYTVLETIMEEFQEHTQNLFEIFKHSLRDPGSLEVRTMTIRSLGVVAQYIDSDGKGVASFQALLPTMLEVIGQCVDTEDKTSVKQLMNILETLLTFTPLLNQHIPLLMELLLKCGGNRGYNRDIRVLILGTLRYVVIKEAVNIQSHGLAPMLLQRLVSIASEAKWDHVNDAAPSRSALDVIDALSKSLPYSQVFPALRNLIQRSYTSVSAADRRGAVLAIGICSKGCSEYMTPLLPEMWPLIEAGLQDEDVSVRQATRMAVGSLCEWLQKECVSKKSVIVSAILKTVNEITAQRLTAAESPYLALGETDKDMSTPRLIPQREEFHSNYPTPFSSHVAALSTSRIPSPSLEVSLGNDLSRMASLMEWQAEASGQQEVKPISRGLKIKAQIQPPDAHVQQLASSLRSPAEPPQLESGPSTTQIICRYFLQGGCGRGTACYFAHPMPSGSDSPHSQAQEQMTGAGATLPCKYFAEGRCTMDTTCRFSHCEGNTVATHLLPPGAQPTPNTPLICKFFLQGMCNKGDSCAFHHPPTAEAPSSPHQPYQKVAGNFFVKVCSFYEKYGTCKKGERCVYKHEDGYLAPRRTSKVDIQSRQAPSSDDWPAEDLLSGPSQDETPEASQNVFEKLNGWGDDSEGAGNARAVGWADEAPVKPCRPKKSSNKDQSPGWSDGWSTEAPAVVSNTQPDTLWSSDDWSEEKPAKSANLTSSTVTVNDIQQLNSWADESSENTGHDGVVGSWAEWADECPARTHEPGKCKDTMGWQDEGTTVISDIQGEVHNSKMKTFAQEEVTLSTTIIHKLLNCEVEFSAGALIRRISPSQPAEASIMCRYIEGQAEMPLDSRNVMLSWPIPMVMAWAHFRSVAMARERAKKLDGKVFNGLKLSVSYQDPRPGSGREFSRHQFAAGSNIFSIKINGLTQQCKEECSRDSSLEKFVGTSHITFGEPSYRLVEAVEELQCLLMGFGSLKAFDVLALNSSHVTYTALAFFEDSKSASTAVQQLQNKQHEFLSFVQLQVEQMHVFRLSHPRQNFLVVKAELNQLQASTAMQMVYKEHDDNGRPLDPIFIFIYGSDAMAVGRLRADVEILLLGEKLVLHHKDIWCKYFDTEEGEQFLKGLNTQNLSGFIRWDRRTKTIHACGNCDTTKQLIGRKIEAFNSEIEVSYLDLQRPAVPLVCPLCAHDVLEPIQLCCDHHYCAACLRKLLCLAAAKSVFTPVVCIATEQKDDSGILRSCGVPISIGIFHNLLSPNEEAALLSSSFYSHVQKSSGLFFCPTPNCEIVYERQDQGCLVECPACHLIICAACGVAAHYGLACAEYMKNTKSIPLRKKEEKRTRKCPKCKADLEKCGGLDHVECAFCNSHVCWVCMQNYPAGVIKTHVQEHRPGDVLIPSLVY